MSNDCINLISELTFIINLFSINKLVILEFPFLFYNNVLSELVGNSEIIFNVNQFIPSDELLIVHFGKYVLSLHVFMVQRFKILNFRI